MKFSVVEPQQAEAALPTVPDTAQDTAPDLDGGFSRRGDPNHMQRPPGTQTPII